MKKSLLITIGSILILIVLIVWGYLLFFGTPSSSDDVFANLGFGGSTQPITPIVEDPVPSEPFTQLGNETGALRQLTTKPVAGFAFVGTTSTELRYVERGTGHVFAIDLTTDTERRVSGTTVPRVTEAVFAPGAGAVALISEDGPERSVAAGVIDAGAETTNLITLSGEAFDPGFVDTTTLRYAVRTEGSTDGYELDIRDNEPIRVFSVPVRDVSLIWGERSYLYNRPARSLPGALYRVSDKLTPVTPNQFGFVSGVNDQYYLYSYSEEDGLVSMASDQVSGTEIPLPVSYLPEKCSSVAADPSLLWCAAPFDALPDTFLENWYQGTVQSVDQLWQVRIARGEAELVANFLTDSGRNIDVDAIQSDNTGARVLFRNKIDQTLWLYDTNLE